MKNSITSLSIAVFVTGLLLTGCQSSATKVQDAEKKVQDANENLTDAKQDLNKAQNDSATEYQLFKKEAEEKIQANDKSIAEFNARIANEKLDNKLQYEKKLSDLQQTNSDLKKKLDDYKEQGKDAWKTFRISFNHDMNELKIKLNSITGKHS
jgi:outer membrane murein-binding lipoprotein Lpp